MFGPRIEKQIIIIQRFEKTLGFQVDTIVTMNDIVF